MITISLSFGARRQTAIVFVAFFCFFLVLISKGKHFLSMASMVISGTVVGLLFSTTPIIQATTELSWVRVNEAAPVGSESKDSAPVGSESKDPAPVGSGPTLSEFCNDEGVTVKTNSGEFKCVPKTAIIKKNTMANVIAQAPIKSIDELKAQREKNRQGAQTQLSETKCTTFINISFENIKCNLVELSFSLTSILFRPLPFIDSGSFSNNLASVENLIWIFLVSIFFYSFFISLKERVKLYITIPTTIFVIAFATLSALYEGNLGTAFRHKSTILWGLILVVTVVLTSNRTNPEKAGKKK